MAFHGVQVDGRWLVVAGAGRLAGLLDSVAVVPGAFDGAGAGAFTAGGDQQGGDVETRPAAVGGIGSRRRLPGSD
jgi:hypothetical protein